MYCTWNARGDVFTKSALGEDRLVKSSPTSEQLRFERPRLGENEHVLAERKDKKENEKTNVHINTEEKVIYTEISRQRWPKDKAQQLNIQ